MHVLKLFYYYYPNPGKSLELNVAASQNLSQLYFGHKHLLNELISYSHDLWASYHLVKNNTLKEIALRNVAKRIFRLWIWVFHVTLQNMTYKSQ